jgi:competence protein CoiA
MLSAMNRFDQQVVAWEANKEDGPFACPECHREVCVKKGNAVVHHFAHVAPSTCVYGTGESVEHWQAKYEIYKALQKHPGVTGLMAERYLKGARPDVSFTLRQKSVAIEIQRSNLSEDKINQRTEILTAKNIYVLWMPFYDNLLSKLMSSYSEEECRVAPSRWEKHLHKMYYGKVYYWMHGETIRVVHFDPYIVGKTYRRWFDRTTGEWVNGYRSPFYRTPFSLKDVRISDLQAVTRPPWNAGPYHIPFARLWCLRG